MTLNITNEIINHIKPMLVYECKNNKAIESVYYFLVLNYLTFYVFYKTKNSEIEKQIDENIENYICQYIEYDLDYEKHLPLFLTKQIRNIVGYGRPLTNFNYSEYIPTFLKKQIDAHIDKKFPKILVKQYPSNIKEILPKKAINIDVHNVN